MTRRIFRCAGFTLIEAIIAMVLTGILAGVVAVFIARPIEGYVDSARRAELTDTADVALRRLVRDVRLALPNSLRVSGGCIEFISTSAGGRYRDPGDGSTGGTFFNWTDTTDCVTTPDNCRFDVMGAMPANPAIAVGDLIAVYNLGPGYEPGNAYNYDAAGDACGVGGCNIAKVSALAGNTVTLTKNPFAAQSPPLPSPNARFQVIPGGTQAVSYVCTGGVLRRFAGYGFSAAQACPPAGVGALVAGSGTTTAACTIDYVSAATGRNGLLFVQLTLTDNTAAAETVTLFQQIHVDNAP